MWLHAATYAAGRGKTARDHWKVEGSAVSSSSSPRCTACHQGELTPTRLKITLNSGGQSFAVDDDDALVCNACGEQFIGERAAALLLS
jgi:YgiT-type zinc finger domain-containing protein